MGNLNDKIKFSNGMEANLSELQELINSINERDFEFACDLLKLWEYRSDNIAIETDRITLDRQIKHERNIELKSDD